MNLKLLGDRILVQPDVVSITSGGIHLSQTAHHPPTTGIVLAVGTGPRSKKGERQEIPLQRGQRIAFSPYGGSEFEWRGQRLKLLTSADVYFEINPASQVE